MAIFDSVFPLAWRVLLCICAVSVAWSAVAAVECGLHTFASSAGSVSGDAAGRVMVTRALQWLLPGSSFAFPGFAEAVVSYVFPSLPLSGGLSIASEPVKSVDSQVSQSVDAWFGWSAIADLL